MLMMGIKGGTGKDSSSFFFSVAQRFLGQSSSRQFLQLIA
jgi:hypothetical protein